MCPIVILRDAMKVSSRNVLLITLVNVVHNRGNDIVVWSFFRSPSSFRKYERTSWHIGMVSDPHLTLSYQNCVPTCRILKVIWLLFTCFKQHDNVFMPSLCHLINVIITWLAIKEFFTICIFINARLCFIWRIHTLTQEIMSLWTIGKFLNSWTFITMIKNGFMLICIKWQFYFTPKTSENWSFIQNNKFKSIMIEVYSCH